MINSAVPSRRLGVIGSIVGLLALVAAVLPHWVVPALYPPEPVDQVIVETGQKLKDRLVARMKHVEYQAPQRETPTGVRLSKGFSVTAISLGLLAIALAVFALVLREERLLAAVSASLGIFAIAVEISFFMIGALILIALIYAVVRIIDLF